MVQKNNHKLKCAAITNPYLRDEINFSSRIRENKSAICPVPIIPVAYPTLRLALILHCNHQIPLSPVDSRPKHDIVLNTCTRRWPLPVAPRRRKRLESRPLAIRVGRANKRYYLTCLGVPNVLHPAWLTRGNPCSAAARGEIFMSSVGNAPRIAHHRTDQRANNVSNIIASAPGPSS